VVFVKFTNKVIQKRTLSEY